MFNDLLYSVVDTMCGVTLLIFRVNISKLHQWLCLQHVMWPGLLLVVTLKYFDTTQTLNSFVLWSSLYICEEVKCSQFHRTHRMASQRKWEFSWPCIQKEHFMKPYCCRRYYYECKILMCINSIVCILTLTLVPVLNVSHDGGQFRHQPVHGTILHRRPQCRISGRSGSAASGPTFSHCS